MTNIYQPYFKNKSDLRTKLKRAGFKFPHDSKKLRWDAIYGNRQFRFRFESLPRLIDVSEPLEDFDRWANSTHQMWSPELLQDFLSHKQLPGRTRKEFFRQLIQ